MASSLAALDMSHPHTYLGPTDSDGLVNFWYELGSAKLSDGTKLPVRLLFNTGPSLGRPLLGKFWWCPLLEMTFLPQNELYSIMSTFGGRKIWLKKNKDGTFKSPDGAYAGRMVSPVECAITTADWEFRFVEGRIRRAKRSDGLELEWIYSSGRITALREVGKGALVDLSFSASDSFPQSLGFDGKKLQLKSQKIPVATQVSGQSLIAGFDTTLAEMSGNRSLLSFPIQLERNGHYVMEQSSNNSPLRTYTWDAGSGCLISDGTYTYSREKGGNALKPSDLAPWVVSRKEASGKIESYFYDPRTGMSVLKRPDGLSMSRSYFLSQGSTFHKLRKVVASVGDKEVQSWQYSYDEQGRIIRLRSGNYEKVWEYLDKDRPSSITETTDGEVTSRKTFDDQGRLTEKFTRGDNIYRYTYDGGKAVVQNIKSGKLISTQVTIKEGPSYVFTPSGTPSVPMTALAEKNSSGFEVARNLAIKAQQNFKNETQK